MNERHADEGTPEAVQRLAAARGGEAFLQPHHVETARRLARLFGRARLMQRTTLSYDPARLGGTRNRPVQAEISDSAADARRLLAQLARQTPGDCWGVLTDICGFDRGLQEVEIDRGWPRRGAKLVLRIGLDHLAGLFGLAARAEGAEGGRMRAWLPERPAMFGDGGD